MKKFSIKEINSIYNYIKNDLSTDNKKEKLIIAHMLLNSLEGTHNAEEKARNAALNENEYLKFL